jgi:hypothetical protein
MKKICHKEWFVYLLLFIKISIIIFYVLNF